MISKYRVIETGQDSIDESLLNVANQSLPQ